MPFWKSKRPKDEIPPTLVPAVATDEHIDDSSTRVASHDGENTLYENRSVPTPDSLAHDIQQQKLMDIDPDSTGPPLSSQPDLLSRSNKRPKEDDEMSTPLQDAKRRRSPPIVSQKSPPPDFNDAKSAIPSTPPQEHLPRNAVGSDIAADSTYSLVEYAQEESTGHPAPRLLKDLETRAITVAQLIQEVKGIYAGLAMVEKKCIEIVDAQLKSPTKLTKEQWQALIALHRTLLNEHHDFFSASHHPVTQGRELRELAIRHAMPARMWRHAIHAFLELLRHKLPDSYEHMVSFLYLSYSMVALLKETVPEFRETWIECLGDLARYRMAIEESDLRDREIWSATARTWYNEAADLSPNTGRIQHHLAVLARPHIVQQLFLYTKALVATIPFKNAGESILLLFNPLLDTNSRVSTRHAQADSNLVCAAAVLFTRRPLNDFHVLSGQFASSFPTHLATTGSRFKVQGPEIAGSLFAMLMDFGNSENKLWRMIFQHQQKMKQVYCEQEGIEPEKLPKDFAVRDPKIIDGPKLQYWSQTAVSAESMPPSSETDRVEYSSDEVTSYVRPMIYQAIAEVAGHIGNKNVVPFMHMVLAYLHGLTWVPDASVYIESCIPWESIANFSNTVSKSGVSYDIVEANEFPKSFGGSKRQLPEDFVMRGLMAMTYYYKSDFFAEDALLDEDERLLEVPSHQAPRVERCLWLAHKLATLNDRWLHYDQDTKEFSATEFAKALGNREHDKENQ